MKTVFAVLAIVCLAGAVLIGGFAIIQIIEPWNGFEDVAYLFPVMVSLILGALLSAFAASVIHGLEQQLKATKKLHAAIVAAAKGEKLGLFD